MWEGGQALWEEINSKDCSGWRIAGNIVGIGLNGVSLFLSGKGLFSETKALNKMLRQDYLANKRNSLLSMQEQLHNAVIQWTKMEESLANSKNQLRKFNTATVAYDISTGNYYYGMNKGVQLSGDDLNDSIKTWLPEHTLNDYKLGNCAEVDAVNQALNSGAKIKNLYLYTIDTKKIIPKEMCENCVYTFMERVAAVLSQ